VRTGLLLVRCGDARDALADRADLVCDAVCGLISARLAARALEISVSFERMHALLVQDAKDAEAVDEMAQHLESYPETVIELEERVGANVLGQLSLLDCIRRPLSDEALAAAVVLSRWPADVASAHDDAAIRLDKARTRAMNELVDDRLAFGEALEASRKEFGKVAKMGGAGCNIDETAPLVLAFAERLSSARARARLFNSRERIFSWDQSDWPALDELSSAIEPYAAMWHAANEFSKAYPGWSDGPLLDVSVSEVEEGVAVCAREMGKATTTLAGCAAPLRVVDDVERRLAETRNMLPLVAALLNPGMRERHWASLTAAAGVLRAPTAMTTLRTLIEAGVPEHLPLVRGSLARASTSRERLPHSLEPFPFWLNARSLSLSISLSL
jgi:dynein heavy chain